jgi:hypothetical protein
LLEEDRKNKKLLEEMGAETFYTDIEIREREEAIEGLEKRLQVCPIFIIIFIAFGAFFLVKWRYEKRLEEQKGPAPVTSQVPFAQPTQLPQYPPTQPPKYPPAQPPQYPPGY